MQNRRDFLKLFSTALAVASLPPALRAAPSRCKISLGFSLYGMKTLPLSTALAECARIGYSNIEIALMRGFPTDPAKLTAADRKAIAAQLTQLGLKVSSLLVDIRLVGDDQYYAATLETIKFAGALAHELDSRHPPVIQTVMGGKPDTWEESKNSMADRLRTWGTTAAAMDVLVAVKGHVAMAVNSPERLLWILKQAASPAIVIAYDHSHFELEGVSFEDSWHMLAPYTRFVHVKEAVRAGKKVRFLLPGEGSMDYRHYFNVLQNAGYTGPVVVEVSSQLFSAPGYDPIKAAEKSYLALAGPLAASDGYRR
jgi:inosose dehydratase